MRFPYEWRLSGGYPPKNGYRVFSTFACGGGSTMGYKLAGFDVVGCCEIDPEMMAIYKANHRPRLAYLEDIRTFRKRSDLPEELFGIDVLDGSPPCSTFSTSGNRDKDWCKEKQFREGQAKQRLDDLFFEFIALADRLKPKVVVAENVKGLLVGNAKGYVKEIAQGFKTAGYDLQVFLLNAASMGVPQKRERAFFVARRSDLGLAPIRLAFDEKLIPVVKIAPRLAGYRMVTASNERHYAEGRYKNPWRTEIEPSPTLTATANRVDAAKEFPGDGTFIGPTQFTVPERLLIGTFPQDYDFLAVDPKYVVGMSVPPVMMARVADEVRSQWLDRCGGG